jgi:hypothetical protein
MAFATPNGLIIRLSDREAFDAIELAKSGTPEEILCATESFQLAPSVLSLIAGVSALGLGLTTWAIVAVMTAAIAVPRILYTWIPGFLVFVSNAKNPFLRVFGGLIFGYIDRGWHGSVAFLLGVIAASVATVLLWPIYTQILGVSRTERSFFLACAEYGVPQDAIDRIPKE